MSWQDIVFGLGGILFSLALIPALRAKEKPPLSTSLLTGSVLAAFVVCYFTLGLYYAGLTGAITAIIWLAIAAQKVLKR